MDRSLICTHVKKIMSAKKVVNYIVFHSFFFPVFFGLVGLVVSNIYKAYYLICDKFRKRRRKKSSNVCIYCFTERESKRLRVLLLVVEKIHRNLLLSTSPIKKFSRLIKKRKKSRYFLDSLLFSSKSRASESRRERDQATKSRDSERVYFR